jgi:hypothetical protein
MEGEIWMSFQTSRGANATLFLGIIIAVWVAARFSSVAVEKGVNSLGKIIMDNIYQHWQSMDRSCSGFSRLKGFRR